MNKKEQIIWKFMSHWHEFFDACEDLFENSDFYDTSDPVITKADWLKYHDCKENLIPYKGVSESYSYCSVCDKKYDEKA